MSGATLWVLLNVVNVLACGATATLFGWRWAVAAAVAREPSPWPSVRALRRRNAGRARVYTLVNAGLLGLGLALIATALRWDGDVPGFVLWGTGLFSVIWVAHGGYNYWDDWCMARVADLAARERRGID